MIARLVVEALCVLFGFGVMLVGAIHELPLQWSVVGFAFFYWGLKDESTVAK